MKFFKRVLEDGSVTNQSIYEAQLIQLLKCDCKEITSGEVYEKLLPLRVCSKTSGNQPGTTVGKKSCMQSREEQEQVRTKGLQRVTDAASPPSPKSHTRCSFAQLYTRAIQGRGFWEIQFPD